MVTNMKQITVVAACLVSVGGLTLPIQANDTAREAVRQSLLNMQQVHSYRVNTADMTDGTPDNHPMTAEIITSPFQNHTITSDDAGNQETIIKGNMFYVRTGSNPWTVQPIQKIPGKSKSHGWIDTYNPAATYSFIRKDTLASTPVSIYSSTTNSAGKREVIEIWVGDRDHLPHRIIRHLTYTFSQRTIQHTIVQTLNAFNAPLKISIPAVAH